MERAVRLKKATTRKTKGAIRVGMKEAGRLGKKKTIRKGKKPVKASTHPPLLLCDEKRASSPFHLDISPNA